MTGSEYQLLAMRTNLKGRDINTNLTNAALGLCGEAGEFADLLKKALFQGHALDCAHMRKELGDILWYIALGADALGVTVDDLIKENVEKLKARYPQGFTVQNSAIRKEGDI